MQCDNIRFQILFKTSMHLSVQILVLNLILLNYLSKIKKKGERENNCTLYSPIAQGKKKIPAQKILLHVG